MSTNAKTSSPLPVLGFVTLAATKGLKILSLDERVFEYTAASQIEFTLCVGRSEDDVDAPPGADAPFDVDAPLDVDALLDDGFPFDVDAPPLALLVLPFPPFDVDFVCL